MKRVVGVMIGLLILLLMVSPTMAASDACPSGGWEILGTHEVKFGETLYCIGRAYGVDPHAIACQNSIMNANLIYPGAILQIPNAPATLPDGPTCDPQFDAEPDGEQPEVVQCGPDQCTCDSEHVVKSGETLTTLAIHYNVPMWDLAHCNCIYNLNYIWIGAKLCIPPSQ